MSHGKVSVDILGDNSELNKALNQSLNLLVDFAAAATLGFARPALNTTVTAVNKLAEAYRTLQPLYQEQIESEVRLQAVLRATGESAGFTFDQLQTYAEQMQNVIGVADHLILNTLAVQASFERIQGNNFQRAAEAAFDMSTVLGTNLTSSVIRVGRALEDPIRGMERLERISITFSQAQKDLIKTLVESNKLFEAQDIILGELENRFGGAAESAGDTLGKQIGILGKDLRNLGEDVFEVFVPAFLEVVKVLRLVVNVAEFAFEALGKLEFITNVLASVGNTIKSIFLGVGEAVLKVVAALTVVASFLSGDTFTFEGVLSTFKSSLLDIFKSINDDVDDLLGDFDRFNDIASSGAAAQRTPLNQLAKDIEAAAFSGERIEEEQLIVLKEIRDKPTIQVAGIGIVSPVVS